MWGAPAGDERADTSPTDQPTIPVMVIAPIGQDRIRAAARPTDPAADGWDGIQQREKLGDVIGVAAGERDRQRDAGRVGQDVMLAPGTATINGARPGFGAPMTARTWLESAIAQDQSSYPTACRRASSSSCRRCHTPVACQSCSRRQQVMPEP
jgi:hypothetical protein